jgi:hypothetical protein
MPFRLAVGIVMLGSAVALSAATIELQPNAVVAHDISPGADVVFFGVGLSPHGYSSRLEQWAEVVRGSEGSTSARLELKEPLAYKSMWAIVDLSTGSYALASPAGYTARQAVISRSLLRKGNGDAADLLTERREFVEMLLVTPKQGVWQFTAMDGAGDDDEKDDGQVSASIEHFRPLGASKNAPKKLSAGDVIIMFDYNRMEAWAFSATDELLRGADATP